jgi:hypothetical protein
MRILFIIIFVFSFWSSKSQIFSSADIPDVMTFLNGSKVNIVDDFKARQEEIKKLWCAYVIGHA